MKRKENILNETRKLLSKLRIKNSKIMASYIDHTNLNPNLSSIDIEQLCKDALTEQFRCISVNPCWLDLAKKFLIGSKIKLCTAISFPFGADTTETKIAAAENAIHHGANELDIVLNIGFLKDYREEALISELRKIIQKCKEIDQRVVTKIIIETPFLNNEEKIIACKCIITAGAEFVKTSTGFFSKEGVTVKDIKLIKGVVGDRARIKASGRIKTLFDTLKMLKAGADLIGTSSGLKILEEIRSILLDEKKIIKPGKLKAGSKAWSDY